MCHKLIAFMYTPCLLLITEIRVIFLSMGVSNWRQSVGTSLYIGSIIKLNMNSDSYTSQFDSFHAYLLLAISR